ncbi:MAG: hypothetical protein ISR45_07425 [Rhodospirillales bacterium]|nr:hypothetical protein [Rhodospirillales bacterium]
MADITVANNVQILPPLKNNTVPGHRVAQRIVADASELVQTSQSHSGAHNTGVNIARSAGLSLYDTVGTALSGQTGKSGRDHLPARLGSIVDIKV